MGAAEHGATFPLAEKIRATMSHQQMHDDAATTNAQIPPPRSIRAHAAALPTPRALRPMTIAAPHARQGKALMLHPHANLGAWLHPKKVR